MVRPGMINLDFADVETVMSSMGKAMMGTGEAEGENRAMAATEMALNNPLIDEYSLKGAKGLLINITGGKDLTLFEVDQTVQKVRAEVDPEVELIFGAIRDENMNGKMRVSVVATALDGHRPETNTVLNMVSRIQNRNNGYSESLFSQNPNLENNTLNSIDGATALKLDEKYEVDEIKANSAINNSEQTVGSQEAQNISINSDFENVPAGVSIESASYIEQNTKDNHINFDSNIEQKTDAKDNLEEEFTPKLFSEEETSEIENEVSDNETHIEKLFDQENNEEEDFEIPAFLRKQKF